MIGLGPLAFLDPWLLLGLIALPALWLLLRILPPAPKRIGFPAIRLLFGLESAEKTPASAPWWLVLLRLLVAALLIVAVAGPILDPERGLPGDGPLILVIDDGFGAAPGWPDRQARLTALAEQAGRADRPVRLLFTARDADGTPPALSDTLPAARAVDRIGAAAPHPWAVDRAAAAAALAAAGRDSGSGGESGAGARVIWASDGIDAPGTGALTEAMAAIGPLTVLTPAADRLPVLAIPPRAGAGELTLTLRRPDAGAPRDVVLVARGPDGRPLARQGARFDADARDMAVTMEIPRVLRNDLAAVTVEAPERVAGAAPAGNEQAGNEQAGNGADDAGDAGLSDFSIGLGAGAVALFDERWSRRPVGIVSDSGRDVGLALLSEVYYLDRALAPIGDLSRAPADILIRAGQAAIFLPDSTPVDSDARTALRDWMEGGGVLVRFAGPRLAQAEGDDLVPVTLRRGGRQLSGALQWTEPARIGSVSPDGPFAGLSTETEAVVKRQVLAEPALDLAEKTWMRLEDDTPLVTAERRGEGWLVLIHTTANTEWSSLALSGLFVEMLQRLTELGAGVATAAPGAADRPLAPVQTLNGAGRLVDPPVTARPIPANALEDVTIGPGHPPGFYGTETVRQAVSLGPSVGAFEALPPLPPGAVRAGYDRAEERPLDPWFYLAALALLLIDGIVTLLLRGQFPGVGGRPIPGLRGGGRAGGAGTAVAVLLCAGISALALTAGSPPARAQDDARTIGPAIGAGAGDGDAELTGDEFALRAVSGTTLAYVETGDPEVDRIARAGLSGLTAVLRQRTAVEAAEPLGVDVNEDELSFFPLLYWPVTESQPDLHQGALDRLNRFLANGGTILFDTRDAHVSGGWTTGGSPDLRRLTQGLDVPELTPVPPDHVLTKSFYLMQDFPGRWTGGTLWIEKPGATVNDGVARILVGAADWAGAWAEDAGGRPMFPVVPGGDRQREMAYRFGVNLVMYALTGNYKADQVHVPAILERLGQ